MTSTKGLCASVAAISFAGLFLTAFAPNAYALDPGFGVGRPGPGVYRRAPVARAAVVRPVPVAPVARAAVVTPAAPVAAAAVVTPAAPVAAAAVATPAAAVATPVAAAGCSVVVVNGVRVRRCGAVARPAVYRPVVRGGRVIVVR